VTKNITAQTAKAVEELRDEHVATTCKPKPQPTTEKPFTDYWEDVYLPTVKHGLKPSTVYGYLQIWEQFLKEHFTGRTFRAYEPHHGNKLLNDRKGFMLLDAVPEQFSPS
jgi:hypothetical protein